MSGDEKKFSMDDVVRGRVNAPPAILIYGPPAIGKSSLASQAPGVFFLATVNVDRSGTNELDVARVSVENCKRKSTKEAKCAAHCQWQRVLDAIDFLADESSCKTIAVDHMGGIQEVLVSHLLAIDPAGKKSMTLAHGGFYKAWDVAVEEIRTFISHLDDARAKGKEVILIAHSFVKKVRDPELDQWEQHQIDVNEKIAMELRKWLDCVFYCNFDRHTYEEQGRKKAISTGQRLMHTQPPNSMAYFAKDRFSLPATIELSHAAFRKAYENRPTVDSVRLEIATLVPKLPADKRDAVLDYSVKTSDVRTLIGLRDRVTKIVETKEDVTKEVENGEVMPSSFSNGTSEVKQSAEVSS